MYFSNPRTTLSIFFIIAKVGTVVVQVPRFIRSCSHRSFLYQSVKEWNNLGHENNTSWNLFKTKLNHYCCSLFFVFHFIIHRFSYESFFSCLFIHLSFCQKCMPFLTFCCVYLDRSYGLFYLSKTCCRFYTAVHKVY